MIKTVDTNESFYNAIATNGKNKSAGSNFLDALLGHSYFADKNIQDFLLDNQETINIFEHYAGLDEDNMKFLLSDTSSLLSNISQLIEDEIHLHGADSENAFESLVGYFDKLFKEIDALFGTRLSNSFQRFAAENNKADLNGYLSNIFIKMNEQFKFEDKSSLQINIKDKFNISYLLEKLSSLGDNNTDNPLNFSEMHQSLNFKHVSIKSEKAANDSVNSSFQIQDEIEMVNNNQQNGDFQNNKEQNGFSFANNNLFNGLGIDKNSGITTSTNNITSDQQSHINHTFRTVRLYETGRIISGFIRQVPESGSGTARLILEPATLGMIIVDIKLKGTVADVNIKVNSRESQAAIESQIGILKERMLKQGIEADKIEINYIDSEKDYYQASDNSKNGSNTKERQDFLNSFKELNLGETDEATESPKQLKFFTGKIIEKYV